MILLRPIATCLTLWIAFLLIAPLTGGAATQPLHVAQPEQSARPAQPAHPSCNAEPSNTDCNGQFTPGGCYNDAYYQDTWESAYASNSDHNLLGFVNIAYSSHCGSNWANGETYWDTARCINIIQRASGPDGGTLTIDSQAFGPGYGTNYEGVLIYAPREYARAAIECWYPTDGNIMHQSAWTPWFLLQP